MKKMQKNGKNNCAVFAKMEILTIYFGKDENVMPICLMK